MAYTLVDPRPIVAEHPYTFFVPSQAECDAIVPGQLVKLMFAADPPGRKYGAERMWVEVTARDGSSLTGTLDNEPSDIPGLSDGDRVTFSDYHIISVIWDDPDMRAAFIPEKSDQSRFFERCFVDDAVLEGRASVQYIYREAPEHSEEDKDPDSGWRIRADVQALTDEEYENPTFSYVAIGAVLNRDDSILELLGAPIGSAYLRGDDGTFAPT